MTYTFLGNFYPYGQSVFWSGDNGKNKERALAFEAGTPLEKTIGYKKLGGDQLRERNMKKYGKVRGDQKSNKTLTWASKRFAQNASGNVKTFVCGARPKGVFRRTELPTLLRNRKVTSINGIDRNTLAKMHKASPDRAYRAVCLAELRQARRAAKGNEKLLTDVKARQNVYKAHKKDQFGKNKSNAQSQGQKVSRSTANSRSPNEAPKKSPANTQPPPPQQSHKRGR